MEYQIKDQNNIIDIVVKYKKIKSIYMRVEDGKVKVSAPIGTSLTFIENAILKHKDRLFRQIKQYQSYYDYKDNGYVLIFNKLYKIKLMNMKRRTCSVHEDVLYVYHSDIQKTVEMFLKEVLYEYISIKINNYLKRAFKLKYPQIEIKKYKSRWGCCYTKENRVSFNLSLVHLDKDLIDYVIIHELTHFLVPNHSKDFYCEIGKRLKDYKIRQKRLKEMHV